MTLNRVLISQSMAEGVGYYADMVVHNVLVKELILCLTCTFTWVLQC